MIFELWSRWFAFGDLLFKRLKSRQKVATAWGLHSANTVCGFMEVSGLRDEEGIDSLVWWEWRAVLMVWSDRFFDGYGD